MKRKAGRKTARKPARKSRSLRARQPARRASARGRRKSPAKTATHDTTDDLVAASAEALGLAIDPAWRASVGFNLRLIFEHAARVDEFSLTDEAEPAPVFRA